MKNNESKFESSDKSNELANVLEMLKSGYSLAEIRMKLRSSTN